VELTVGDVVKTESNDVGKVVHISRLTVFVALPTRTGEDTVAAYLASQLRRAEEHPSNAIDAVPPYPASSPDGP
jgi:hypothetical protein